MTLLQEVMTLQLVKKKVNNSGGLPSKCLALCNLSYTFLPPVPGLVPRLGVHATHNILAGWSLATMMLPQHSIHAAFGPLRYSPSPGR